MTLLKYTKKRDFKKTPEPKGKEGVSELKRPIYIIQKHDATRLHYDFRLEIGGALKSWAVPKGPSTDPDVKRLAIETEDHPLGYANFEGVIPEGEYGAGEIIIWDQGNFENIKDDDLKTQYDDGQIEVRLKGEKIYGNYVLIKTNGKNWILKKMKGDDTDSRRNPISTQPESVKTGATIEDIKHRNEQRKDQKRS